MKILEAESEICDILLLVLKILMWLKNCMFGIFLVIWVCVPFFKEDFLCVKIEEKVACGLSSLFRLSSCFSQKFAKGGDCWIFVCWLHFCLKQIFTSDVEHNVPTSRHGFVCSVPCLILRTRLFCLRNQRLHYCWSTYVSLLEDQNIFDFLRKC